MLRDCGETLTVAWIEATRAEATRDARERLSIDMAHVALVGFDDRLGAHAERIVRSALDPADCVVKRFVDLGGAPRTGDELWLVAVATDCGPACVEDAIAFADGRPHVEFALVCSQVRDRCAMRALRAGIRNVIPRMRLAEKLPTAVRSAADRREWTVPALIEEQVYARIVHAFGVEAAEQFGYGRRRPRRTDDLYRDERRQVQDALLMARGNKTRSAAWLGIPRTTLLSRMRALGITAPTVADANSRIRAWPYRRDDDGESR